MKPIDLPEELRHAGDGDFVFHAVGLMATVSGWDGAETAEAILADDLREYAEQGIDGAGAEVRIIRVKDGDAFLLAEAIE